MRTQSVDTSLEAERVHIGLLRKASPAKLFGLARSLTETLILMNRQTIRQLHPDASEEGIGLICLELYYGKELADRVRTDVERRKGV